MSGSHPRCFVGNQGRLGIHSPAVTAQCSHAGDDPVTRNQPGNRISTYCTTDGTAGPGFAQVAGDGGQGGAGTRCVAAVRLAL